jgi:DNA modification methylase
MIKRFFEKEAEYEVWIRTNNSGYVLNYFDDTEMQSKMNKLHKANCPFLMRVR